MDFIIKFLVYILEIVDFFNEKCVISNENDSRLKKFYSFYLFMKVWKEECGEDNSKFVLSKLWFDI